MLVQETAVLEVVVQDVRGKVVQVLAQKEAFSKGSHQLTFNSEGQLAGMYFLLVKSKDQLVSRKMVLIR